MLDEEVDLYTTSHALAETMALIHSRLGFDVLTTFVESILVSVKVIWMEASSHEAAWQLMRSYGGRRLSLVDCTVILAARELDADVFAYDSDFVLEGLTVVG